MCWAASVTDWGSFCRFLRRPTPLQSGQRKKTLGSKAIALQSVGAYRYVHRTACMRRKVPCKVSWMRKFFRRAHLRAQFFKIDGRLLRSKQSCDLQIRNMVQSIISCRSPDMFGLAKVHTCAANSAFVAVSSWQVTVVKPQNFALRVSAKIGFSGVKRTAPRVTNLLHLISQWVWAFTWRCRWVICWRRKLC